MSRYYVYAERFFMPDGERGAGYLEIAGGKFGEYHETAPDGVQIVYRQGTWIAPGFVDTHIHGIAGHDVMDNDPEGLRVIAQEVVKNGVTSFLPTTLTADAKMLGDVAEMIGTHEKVINGARIQGIFFEGPFFTETYKGAQNPAYLARPDLAQFLKWQEKSGGMIRKIAIAPELPGAGEFIRAMKEMGVTVALGHSAASYDEAAAAVQAGATVFVHTFNGMSGFGHREPGMAGCAMCTEETVAEVIGDGIHVHPAAVKALVRAKSPDRVALVTDCMRAGNMPEGEYVLGELPVIVKDGTARLKSGNNLAGSILAMNTAVRNMVEWGITDHAQAIRMASYVPAMSVGIADRCGGIIAGHAADFIALSPDMDVLETWIDGESVYRK